MVVAAAAAGVAPAGAGRRGPAGGAGVPRAGARARRPCRVRSQPAWCCSWPPPARSSPGARPARRWSRRRSSWCRSISRSRGSSARRTGARPDGEHKRSNAAFPSSHTANAFAVATVVARRWRKAAVPAFLLAAAVGWSRVYLNRHWASDALAGALLAIGLALLVSRWWQSRRKPKDIPTVA